MLQTFINLCCGTDIEKNRQIMKYSNDRTHNKAMKKLHLLIIKKKSKSNFFSMQK